MSRSQLRTVAEVSEAELLALITPALPRSGREVVGNGDDCAVLTAPDGRYVVSTDVLVEGHHFRRKWSTAYQIGRRAAAQNLADVAAMGAVPVAVVVSLVLPPTTPLAWVRELAAGLGAECAAAGAGVVGGDLSAGEQVVIAVTVHGDLAGRAPVVRSGARAGDVVVLAGRPGLSAAGLALAQAGLAQPGALEAAAAEGGVPAGVSARQVRQRAGQCLDAFRCPSPPLAAGPALADAGATAMMDVSDSLLRDCGRLAAASGVVIDLDDPADGGAPGAWARWLEPVAALLLAAGTVERKAGGGVGSAAGLARRWVLTGGEDHGMLATLPAGVQVPSGCAVIGRVLAAGSARAGVLVGGRTWHASVGWDHFAPMTVKCA